MGARTGRPRGWRDDPAWRHQRALAAGRASGVAAHARALARVAHLKPAAAYSKGYGNGYRRAYVYWQRWARRTVAQLAGRKVAHIHDIAARVQ